MTMTPYYEQDNITIYHGDCRDVLPLVSGDLVATDPPYGVGFRGAEWDEVVPDWWLPLARAAAPVVAFTTAPLTVWQYPPADWIACWGRPASNSRTPQGGFNHWSPVLLYGAHKLQVDFLSLHAIAYSAPDWITHPCPKPPELFKWLITSLLPNGGRVIDPFCGSGAVLLAAKECGCSAVGIEKDESYCAESVKRLAQGVLFGGAARPPPPRKSRSAW
jgi:site-specific DNA-methyltransferase (adenine-specific)